MICFDNCSDLDVNYANKKDRNMTALDLAEESYRFEIFKWLLADNRTGNHINHYSYISTFKTCGVKNRFNFCKRIFDIEVNIGHSVT